MTLVADRPISVRPHRPRAGVEWSALVFAMLLPTGMVLVYFLALAGGGEGRLNPAQQGAYILAKIVQFTFPIGFVLLYRLPVKWGELCSWRGLGVGMGFGLLVSGALLGLYFGGLRESWLLAPIPTNLSAKLREFGIVSPARYFALAAFIVVAHSFLEEYYWRWFVFGRLCERTTVAGAMLLSSLAFMSHHVVLLHGFLPGRFWTAVIPFSLAIAVGGAFWAWLFRTRGSLLTPWLSHLLVDLALVVIGWDLVLRGGIMP